jgi:phosphoribosylformimino-5-aminoimidazole carboxamide ribotide isomerase
VELIPAVDLLGGRVVRLRQGDFDAVSDYGDDPVEVSRRWVAAGARRLHLVDLDAARTGTVSQADVIGRVVQSAGVPCQVAGGIRSAERADAALAAGADRVVLGSALIDDPTLAATLIDRHGAERIVAALDVRDGQALGDGWGAGARGSGALEHAARLATAGVRWLAVTAIARDGAMSGPDLELLAEVRAAAPGCSIIASGGIGRSDDIRVLVAAGYEAAILGRALYEGVFTLPDALAAADGASLR